MASFEYTAKSKDGVPHQGRIEAKSKGEALKQIESLRLVPIMVKEATLAIPQSNEGADKQPKSMRFWWMFLIVAIVCLSLYWFTKIFSLTAVIFIAIVVAVITAVSVASIKRDMQYEYVCLLIGKMRQIFEDAKEHPLPRSTIQEFKSLQENAHIAIDTALQETSMLGGRNLTPHQSRMLGWIEEIEKMELFVLARCADDRLSVGDELQKLVNLRTSGAISQKEFDAFSERFKLSTGEKAQNIVDAISALYAQYSAGAMAKGNYDDALWSLLDKMERKT